VYAILNLALAGREKRGAEREGQRQEERGGQEEGGLILLALLVHKYKHLLYWYKSTNTDAAHPHQDDKKDEQRGIKVPPPQDEDKDRKRPRFPRMH
jgi:hypothetical protein